MPTPERGDRPRALPCL